MTVMNSQSSVLYQGNDSSVQFPIPFPFAGVSSLKVFLVPPDGVARPVEQQNFAVDETASDLLYPIFGIPLPTGWQLAILRYTEDVQPLDLTNQGAFYPESVEGEFDRVVLEIQEVRRDVARALKIPLGSEEDTERLTEELLKSAQQVKEAADRAEGAAETATGAIVAVEAARDQAIAGIAADKHAAEEAARRAAIDASTANIASTSAKASAVTASASATTAVTARDQAAHSATTATDASNRAVSAAAGVAELADFLKVLDYGEIADLSPWPKAGVLFDFGAINHV